LSEAQLPEKKGMFHVPEIRDFGFGGSGQLKTAFVFSPGCASLKPELSGL
jgi:hypothetical protein